MADQERHLTEVQQLARGLRGDREDLGQSREELTESLAELHREPRATVELTEGELEAILGEGTNAGDLSLISSARQKFSQALAIESGPGGAFVDPS